MASIAPLPAGARPCVWLLCGGPSSEYQVSLASARGVLAGLDFARFCVRLACVSPEGRWLITPHAFYSTPAEQVMEDLFALLQHPDSYPMALSLGEAMRVLESDKPLVAFNAMHGPVGEDGTVQALFALAGVAMTGSGIAASALAMDKIRSRDIFRSAGLDIPKGVAWSERSGRPRPATAEVDAQIGFPCIVKPAAGGSSFGVTLVRYARDLDHALDKALDEGTDLLVEEYVRGTELTCGVLEMRGQLTPLAVTQIKPLKGEFFDYEAKYSPGAAEEVTPAPISDDDSMVVQSAAMVAHKALGCSGYSRADFILTAEGRLVILEVNTLPGMTRTSLLPQGAAAKGIGMGTLVGHMIAAALRHQSELPFAPLAGPVNGQGQAVARGQRALAAPRPGLAMPAVARPRS